MSSMTPPIRMVSVPVEPTEAMMLAADAVDWNNEDERAAIINMWQAMLTAAPVREEGGAVEEDAHHVASAEAGQRIKSPFELQDELDRAVNDSFAKPRLTVVEPDQWQPCSPDWLERHPSGCGKAPRVWCEAESNHYHPRNWPQVREEAPAEAGENLVSAIDAFMPSAEVAFLWTKETPSVDEVQRYRDRYWAVKEALLRLRAQPQAREEAQPVAWPETCDGTEQPAFEEWATKQRFDMNEHPLHYLFLDPKTDAARQGWKAGLKHAVERMKQGTPPAPEAEKLRVAVADIAIERQRQVEVEGWSEAHDDEHDAYQMARAAGCYAFHASRDDDDDDDDVGMFVSLATRHGWPWDRAWWKPKSRRADLVRAGALIVAEIERLDRQALAALQQEGR